MKNGDRWTVHQAHADGSLTVQRPGARGRRSRVTLPAGYVAEHVELGYAIIAHRERLQRLGHAAPTKPTTTTVDQARRAAGRAGSL